MIVAAVAAWGLSALRSPELPATALAAAPVGSSIVMRVDVKAVTASHVWNALLEEDRGEDGMRRIEVACGYDPLEQVEEAFVFVSDSHERPFEDVGIVARGEMARGRKNRERLVECVRAVVSKGGALSQVEIEGVPAIASSSGRSHAAFLGKDGVVAGSRAMVTRLIQVAMGDALSAQEDETLERLWARVSTDRDVVAVARVPERWAPALERMAADLGQDFEAVGRVRALGVGVRVRDGLSIGLAAETATAAAASELEQALKARMGGLLRQPLLRLSTFGRILRRIKTEAQGSELVVTASLTNAQVDALLGLWRQLRKSSRLRSFEELSGVAAMAVEEREDEAAVEEPGDEAGEAEAEAEGAPN